MLGLDQESDQDDDNASDMDPDTDSVHDGNELDQEGVDQSVDNQNQKVDQHHMPTFRDPSSSHRNN